MFGKSATAVAGTILACCALAAPGRAGDEPIQWRPPTHPASAETPVSDTFRPDPSNADFVTPETFPSREAIEAENGFQHVEPAMDEGSEYPAYELPQPVVPFSEPVFDGYQEDEEFGLLPGIFDGFRGSEGCNDPSCNPSVAAGPHQGGLWIDRFLSQFVHRCRALECGFDEYSLGTIRMPFAPFQIDPAQLGKFTAVRFDAVYDWQNPTRLEYLWSKTGGKGPPKHERSVDYLDLRLYTQIGSETAVAFTDLPLRQVDPVVNPNAGGFGDMSAGSKVRLVKKERFQLSQIFTTYINTGRPDRGLGSGHVSLEPGLLANYRLGPWSMLHGELKYWIPIAADKQLAGNMLRYGLGISYVWREGPCEDWAIIPSLELVGWSVFEGGEVLFSDDPMAPTQVVPFDPAFMLNIQPGLRVALGDDWDVGMTGGFGVTEPRWYDGMFRFELRRFF